MAISQRSALPLVLLAALLRYALSARTTCATHAPPDAIPPGFTTGLQRTNRTTLYYLHRPASPATPDAPTLLFLHGWPQTWTSFHRTLSHFPPSYHLLLLNLPGVAPSAKPPSYTKLSMARDVDAFLTAFRLPAVHVVAHDIGAMVAYALAVLAPSRVRSLTILDVPLPGTPAFDLISSDPRAWHFGFNAAEQFPEALTTGREAFFYAQFMRELQGSPDALSPAEIRVSVDAYSVPSTAQAGFGWYRAFAQDAEDNRRLMRKGKLKMPVLALNAGRLSPTPYVLLMMQELAEDVRGGAVDSGHWIPEEKADELVGRVVQLLSEVESPASG